MTAHRLLAVPTSGKQKPVVSALVERFSPISDIWLFVWDGSSFDEPPFDGCRVISRAGYNKWDFAREYLTPDEVDGYDFLFVWDDDLDATLFDPDLFIAVMACNELEMAQPALTGDSYFSHPITLRRPGVGRFTDFVEVMAPVWTRAAWPKWYEMLIPENPWGWGYDLAARSACGYERMGIVDCAPVRHLKPLTRLPEQYAGMQRFFAANPKVRPCNGEVFASLSAPVVGLKDAHDWVEVSHNGQ